VKFNRQTFAAAFSAIGIILSAGAVNAQVPRPEEGIVLKRAELAISYESGKDSIVEGEALELTIAVKNIGQADAIGVKTSATLPHGYQIEGESTYTFTFPGSVLAGNTVQTSFTATSTVDSAPGDFITTASAQAANADPVTSRMTITVRSPVVLGVEVEIPMTTEEELGADEPSDADSARTPRIAGAATELAATGISLFDLAIFLVGSVLVITGIDGLRLAAAPVRRKR